VSTAKPLSAKDYQKFSVMVETLYSSAITPEYFAVVKNIRDRLHQPGPHTIKAFTQQEVKQIIEMHKALVQFQRRPLDKAQALNIARQLGQLTEYIIEDEDRAFIQGLNLELNQTQPLEGYVEVEGRGVAATNPADAITPEYAERIKKIYERYKQLLGGIDSGYDNITL
jgi:hypothetical protein